MSPKRQPRLATPGQRRHRPDYSLFVLSLVFIIFGLVVVYAISPSLGIFTNKSESYYANKQLLTIGLGLIAFITCAVVPIKWFLNSRQKLIVAAALTSIAVMAFGQKTNGATRWIQFGGFSFQAAELIKFTLVIWLASFLGERLKNGEIGDHNKTIKPLMVVLAVIAVVVVGLQSDLGSAGVMVAMIGLTSFVAGVPYKRIAMIGGLVVIGGILAVSVSSYRRERLMTFLHPTADCQSTGYQACQALIAVGSGGPFGLGLGRSVQAAGYLPEAANDSIFAILAEKFGFIGVMTVIGLYMALFTRLRKLVSHSEDITNRLVVSAVLAWVSTQTIINIGAMIGLLPLKGITLPLISYGGTSLVFVMAAMGLTFQISRYSAYRQIEERTNSYDNRLERRRYRRAYNAAASRQP